MSTHLFRSVCTQCRKAATTCYCAHVRPFESPVPFVILQHPREARNAIATARMAHLCISNSRLYVEKDFSQHRAVNALLQDPSWRHMLLFPHPSALDIDEVFCGLQPLQSNSDHSPQPKPMLWVLDAKWGQVPQMLRRSTNLRGIPFVQFRPTLQSQFRVRRQPDRHCLSTIESIHYVIDRYCTLNGGNDRRHDALLDVFRYLVEQQIEFAASRPSHRHTHAQRLGDSTLSKA